jgi:transglycosylase-like protein with SLT domain
MRLTFSAASTASAIIFRVQVCIFIFVATIATLVHNVHAQPAPTPAASAPLPGAQVVRIPLTIDYLALSAAMKQQLYPNNGRVELWNGADQCQYLYGENPRFGRAADKVKLESDGSLMIGVMVGSQCVSPITWTGIIEVETTPYIAPNLQLKFRVSDINLYDQNHQKSLLVGKGFDLIKQYYIPRMETFTFDLSPAFQQFEELVKAGAPPEVAERVAQTLTTLRAEPELRAEDNGVRAVLDLTEPAFAPLPTASASAQLTPQELAVFEKNLDQWDSFLVYAIKQMGVTSNDPQLRDDLLALLLDSRYRLVDALAHPQSAGPDPIRILFLDQWQRLGEIIRQAVRRGTLGSQALQFLSFMSAGDALFALDQAAPALGMRISTDDLRRLAHMLGPTTAADPLEFNFQEDPELRKMFHVKEPLSSEGPLDTESAVVETPSATASPSASPIPGAAEIPAAPATTSAATSATTSEGSASATPAAGNAVTAAPSEVPSEEPTPIAVIRGPSSSAPAASPSVEAPDKPSGESAPTPELSPETSPTPAPLSMLKFPLWVLFPNDADAAEAPPTNDLVGKLQALARKLKRVVVNPGNAAEYRGNYDQLLQYSAQREIGEENIDPRFRPLYLRLVKSAAWQESCWRQFVLEGNHITFLESSTHDLGLMQVNKYVWRGFYNVERLEWDVLYNAGAGTEILARLLGDVAGKRGAFSASNPDELARSIYAAYNGGPGSYRRWRAHEAKALRHIDSAFWEKYQAVQHGEQIDILSCASDWGSDH